MEQKDLIAAYESLDSGIQGIVQTSAVLGKPLHCKDLTALAINAGVKHANGRALNFAEDVASIHAAIQLQVMLGMTTTKNCIVDVSPALSDYVFRDAFNNGFAQRVVQELEGRSKYRYGSFMFRDEPAMRRKQRMAFYEGDFETWIDLIKQHHFYPIVLDPFCWRTFQKLPLKMQVFYVQGTLASRIALRPLASIGLTDYLEDYLDTFDEVPYFISTAILDYHVACGDLPALARLQERPGVPQAEIQGCYEFLQGNYDVAQPLLEKANQEAMGRFSKRIVALSGMASLFRGFMLLRENSPAETVQLKRLIKAMSAWSDLCHELSLGLQELLDLRDSPLKSRLDPRSLPESRTLGTLTASLGWHWYSAAHLKRFPSQVSDLQTLAEDLEAFELDFLAAIAQGVLSSVANKRQRGTSRAQRRSLEGKRDIVAPLEFIEALPLWDTALSALERVAADVPATVDSGQGEPLGTERLIWELAYATEQGTLEVTPFLQKRGKRGWTKGRKLALSRLYQQWDTSEFQFLTEADRSICRCLREAKKERYYGYRETVYRWDEKRLPTAVVAHPHLYRAGDRKTPVEVTSGQPHLTVRRQKKDIQLSISPPYENEPVAIVEESSQRIRVVEFSKQQQQVAELVAAMPTIPADREQRVADLAGTLSATIDIQSDIEGIGNSGEAVEPSSDLVVQLTPYQDGIRAELFVQPLGESGPLCRPGAGAPTVFANIDAKPITTNRDLQLETKNLQQLLKDCPALGDRAVSQGQSEWILQDVEDALELISELQPLAQAESLKVMWPRGKTFEVAALASSGQLQVSVRRDRDWFAASGKLKVDDQLTLDMIQLLELAGGTSSRFVQLDDGRFLALTRELRQRLSGFEAFGDVMKNKLRFSAARALVVDDLLESTTQKTDRYWKAHLSRIREADSLNLKVPKGFQADLRDYQVVGYRWLKRLAHWNTGACLADDMGLGKTIQALALLVDRAKQGPALVVAPASVGFNWESETHRFAPSLRPLVLRDHDREALFEDLKPGDLVITSYGLLQTEVKRLAKQQWSTVILDEAQAIKNSGTKRSKAAMQLKADFKVALTGTPLENHLGEMWNLFRFIVPGLLGSDKVFRERFANPIEKDQCPATQARLRKLVHPFLLRRTKSEVLTELPSRSDSVWEVELSPEEAALYEALRLKAMERIQTAAAGEQSQGEQHLQVLAELTRLRLACCHPTLVGGKGVGSAKLDLFRDKVGEIIDGNHKVLVFSQFVKHLKILRNELETMGIAYQYLDGSTPAKKRQKIVEAFQAGEGDVFLISLKAGGTGLNLTAADYVIHMDPWWNPAVEDQASDRAHRIGQQRPVNVYRLIAKGTIEERIMALHHSKRDLADSLLSGASTAAKLSTEDLIDLLKENAQEANAD